jgi:peroxiredoxin
MIKAGDRLPEATLLHMGADGAEEIDLGKRIAGKRVVLIGMPGAFTKTCSRLHLPSFIRTADAFREKGIDEIICVTVNDIWVVDEWGRQTGASEAGITMVADWKGDFAKALGLAFTAPPVGFLDRMQRFAMIVNDGEVETMNMEEERGVCDMTAGETLLEAV